MSEACPPCGVGGISRSVVLAAPLAFGCVRFSAGCQCHAGVALLAPRGGPPAGCVGVPRATHPTLSVAMCAAMPMVPVGTSVGRGSRSGDNSVLYFLIPHTGRHIL